MLETENYLWKRVNWYLRFLRWIPFLRMVAVCNNLSFGKVSEKSDIDLFVITAKNRLFIVRTLVIAVLHILGVRLHGKKIKGRFCLSFFIDDSRLDLKDIALEKDVYLAFWVKSLLPILDDGVSRSFLESNLWAKEYFEKEESFVFDYSRMISNRSVIKRLFQKILNGNFGRSLENLLMNWQLKRARSKAAKIANNNFVIEKNILKFHHNDRRILYRERWNQSFGRDAKITTERFIALDMDVN